MLGQRDAVSARPIADAIAADPIAADARAPTRATRLVLRSKLLRRIGAVPHELRVEWRLRAAPKLLQQNGLRSSIRLPLAGGGQPRRHSRALYSFLGLQSRQARAGEG